MTSSESRFSLRSLPLPAKLVISVFLISVGTGYFTALVQLHFQHASPGELVPNTKNTREIFNGQMAKVDGVEVPKPKSKIESLIMAPEGEPFNGSGTMAPAFYERSGGWAREIRRRGEPKVRAERDTERAALVAWINSGEKRREYYEKDNFPLPPELHDEPMTADFLGTEENTVAIRYLIDIRCLACHTEGGEGKVSLESYDDLVPYIEVPTSEESGDPMSPRRMSLTKLAQSTHAHWLSFSMLFALTGLTFAFTSYPVWMRASLAPIVLVLQMMEISCWWLARLDGSAGLFFADAIVVVGAGVGLGLCIHIVLSLFDMYGAKGRAVLVVLFLAALGGGFVLKTNVIDPHLADEKAQLEATEEAKNGG